MIGLDTNVLLRYLVQDNVEQAKVADDLIAGLNKDEPGYICREVIVELVWVLDRVYKMPRKEAVSAVGKLVFSKVIVVEDNVRVERALVEYARGGPELTDRMILAATVEAGCNALLTFDKKLAAQNGAELLSWRQA